MNSCLKIPTLWHQFTIFSSWFDFVTILSILHGKPPKGWSKEKKHCVETNKTLAHWERKDGKRWIYCKLVDIFALLFGGSIMLLGRREALKWGKSNVFSSHFPSLAWSILTMGITHCSWSFTCSHPCPLWNGGASANVASTTGTQKAQVCEFN